MSQANPEVEDFICRNLAQGSSLKDGVVSIQYLSESTYVGQIDDEHRKQGQGVYKYSNNDMYWGAWKADLFHGFGSYKFSNGDTFRGFFQGGECAQGSLQESSGNIYQGQFSGGKKHGRGAMKFNNGNRYEGQWQNGDMHGRGNYYSKEFQVEGTWNRNMLKGPCSIKCEHFSFDGIADGEVLVEGRIKIQYRNGESYEGDIKGSKKQGRGVYFFSGNCRYEGEFSNDQINGKGKLYTSEGYYLGMFQSSMPNGDGVYVSKNGITQQGCWKQGQLVYHKQGHKSTQMPHNRPFHQHNLSMNRSIGNASPPKIVPATFHLGVGPGRMQDRNGPLQVRPLVPVKRGNTAPPSPF